jgi:hypothetical protein
MHHVEPVVLQLMLVAALFIVANKCAIPYPVLLVLGGLALSFVPLLPVIRLDPRTGLFLLSTAVALSRGALHFGARFPALLLDDGRPRLLEQTRHPIIAGCGRWQ